MPSVFSSVQATPLSASKPTIPRTIRLSLGKGAADLSTTLPGVQAGLLALNDVGSLLDDFLALGEDELDVARVGHVGVNLVWSVLFSLISITR